MTKTKPYCTVSIGGKTKEEIEKELKESNVQISDWAKDIFNKCEFQKEKETFDLFVLSVSDMGFQNGATIEEIYAKIAELGYSLCPADVGPALTLQFKEKNDWVRIAMESITDSGGDRSIFDVEDRAGRVWLCRSVGDSGDFYRGGDRFVVCLRKSSTLGTSELSETLTFEKAVTIIKNAGYVIIKPSL